MDIGKAFGQMFKDPKWVKKMLFYGLFCFLCVFLVGIPFVAGYTILILNNYMQGKDELPEWEGNWENILMTGLKFIVFGIIFGVVSWIISFFSSGILSIVARIMTETDGLEMIGLILTFVQMGVSFFISAVITLVGNMAQIRFAKNLSFSDVFDFDWYFSFFKKSWSNLIVVWLLSIVTGIISMAGLFALCVGVFFTAFYAMVTNAALLAEVAKAAGETATSSDPVKATTESAPTALPVAPAKVTEEGPVKMVK